MDLKELREKLIKEVRKKYCGVTPTVNKISLEQCFDVHNNKLYLWFNYYKWMDGELKISTNASYADIKTGEITHG